MSTPENVKLVYLYRDASNYKAWGEIIFRNPDKLSLNEIEDRLRSSFDSQELFVASQVSIPDVFLFFQDRFTEDDHFFHEFHAVEFTIEQDTDSYDRTIKSFVEQVEHSGKNGWRLLEATRRQTTLLDDIRHS